MAGTSKLSLRSRAVCPCQKISWGSISQEVLYSFSRFSSRLPNLRLGLTLPQHSGIADNMKNRSDFLLRKPVNSCMHTSTAVREFFGSGTYGEFEHEVLCMSSIPGVHLLGNENPDSLAGSVGNDTLTGGGEVDTLQGFDCDDRISGNSGGDRGFGNRGRDTLYGGVGDDTLHGGRQDDTLYGEGGDDWLLGDRDDDLVLGDSGRDWMFGGSGMDSLFGNTDSDSLYGGKGNDCLFGGQGDDRLFGDLDDDTLSGDRGADTMTGGDGRDVFAIGFNTGGTTLADADIITDFTPGEDAILLLGNLTFDALNIVAGTGENAGNAIVQNRLTGEFLAVLQGVESTAIDRENFLFQPPAPPLEIAEISPTSGEEMVAPTREAIVRFTRRVDPTSFDDPNAFYLIANGERVPGRVVVSRTEQFATFFPDNPLPASTGVRVVVDGDKIRGRDGTLLSAIDEAAIVATDFRTLPLTQIPDTSVEGYLFDSYNRNPDGSNRPIVGATLTVDGLPDVRAVTDSQGYFKLENVPAPEFFVRIDGSTAINAPPGTQYPTLGKPFHSVPGQTVGLTMDGEAFDIFLPPMALGDIQSLSPTKTTDIGFGLSATAQLVASFPDIDPEVWNLTQVTFFPNGAIDDRGNRATAATIIPVPPDRLPGPLPPGIDPQLVISVQAGNGNNLNAAGGATNFDVPAPLEFPNLEGLSPGEQSLFWAFDHDAGRWEVVGTGTVSADGRMVVSDAGVGLQAPGWVFVQPGVIINVSPDIHLDDAFWRITYGGFELHGQMDGSSQISTVLPENRRFSLTIYDRRGERLGSFDGQTGVSGSILDIQDIEFVSTDGLPDTDGEGLVDAAERVIGTLPDNPDTDADGISDAAEIDGGLNPNDNNPFPTAIIASLPLQGEAKAIVVEGSPDDPTRQTAYLATGSHGLAIVDVTQFDLPIVLGQLNLPGTAIDVAIDANLQIAAVASHTGKLHFVDVADPIQPQLLQTVDVEASYVEVSGGLAYAATGNEIVLVDLATGDILDRRQYAGGNIDDLAIADGFLYTISRSGISPQTVHKIELTGNILTAPIDSFVVEDRPTFGRLHIAAGGGFVYVGAIDDNFTNQIPGVTILQDTESGMVLVGPPFGLTAFDVAPNGSDLLLFTGANTFGPLGGGVGLLDVSDPTRTDRFLTSFTTPDGALDIAIASGIAFVASNTAGLQVINYLPFDSQGQAPTVAIDSPVVDADPDTPGVQVVENTLVPVSAQVTDDVQVRNVELLFNGEVVRNDVSFPFDVSAFAPDFTEVGETFTIQVRATDTGGNSTLSNVLEFELLEDIFGPVVIRSFPEPGGVGFSSASL